MLDKFHLTFNFKSKLSHEAAIKENECQLTSTSSSKMSTQSHMTSSTCYFNFMSSSKLCVSSGVHFLGSNIHTRGMVE
jgi:hypothetical protein